MKKVLLMFLTMISLTLVQGQSVQSIIPTVPTSPQAEAFKRYGDYAVNNSTGIPNISIALYQINHHGYTIPLTLSYNPQPLKPGYNYDVYGHGWGLSLSSAISRSIEGPPDELSSFRIEQERINDNYYTSSNSNAWECYVNWGICNMAQLPHLNPLGYNFTHDKFNVVLPNGTSFDFIIDNKDQNNTLTYTVSEGRQVKINCDYSTSNINSFTITDEEGIKYTFDDGDIPYGGSFTTFYNNYVSWKLSRIELPYSSEPINLSYDYSIQSNYGVACVEPGILLADDGHSEPDGTRFKFVRNFTVSDAKVAQPNYYRMKLLSSISYGSSQINLLYRDPNQNYPSYNYVKGIQVYENSALIRDIKLGMTIIDAKSSCTTFKLAKLDNVSIKGSNSADAPLVYTCNYSLSSYEFRGTDHWGNLSYSDIDYDLANFNLFVGSDPDYFFAYSSNRITPVTKLAQDINPYYKIKLSRSNSNNRNPGGNHGVLTRLTYPTGGYTDFEFESNKFLTSTDYDGNYILDPQNRIVANAPGVRIKKITNYTKVGIVANVENYRYGKTNSEAYPSGHINHMYAVESPNSHTGLGVAVVDPNILTYMNYTYIFTKYPSFFLRNMIVGLDQYGAHTSFSNPFSSDYDFLARPWRWEATFSAINFRSILNSRPPVLYPEVTVYHGEIDENSQFSPERTLGKTVYKYDVTEHGFNLLNKEMGDAFIEEPKYFLHTIGYTPQNFRYNKLIEQSDYKVEGQAFKIAKKQNYSWNSRSNYFTELSYHNPYPPSVTPYFVTLFELFHQKIELIGVTLLGSKITTLYSSTGVGIFSSENNIYNNRNQLSSTQYTNSEGKIVTKTFSYPKDETGEIIQKMIAKNMISPITKITTKVGDASQSIEKSGSKIEFKEYAVGSSNIIKPSKSYELEIKPSSSNYVLKGEVKNYSVNGNALEIYSKGNFYTSYLWGYDDRYMVAEVKNASAGDIAYSSFEDDAKGNWTYTGTVTTPSAGTFVPTGRKYYNLTSANEMNKTVTNGKIYIITYWSNSSSPYSIKGGTSTVITGSPVGGWAYFEHKVIANGTILSISGSGGIDEVRLYPADAMMATYTYNPLIGMTSQTDENGRTNYYEYDALGRLQLVKDKDGNVVKTLEYKNKQ